MFAQRFVIVQKAGFSVLSNRWHYTSTLPCWTLAGERRLPGATETTSCSSDHGIHFLSDCGLREPHSVTKHNNTGPHTERHFVKCTCWGWFKSFFLEVNSFIHSFTWSVNVYWVPIICQAPAWCWRFNSEENTQTLFFMDLMVSWRK